MENTKTGYIDPIIQKTREEIKTIEFADQHINIYNKWVNIKKIVSAIYEKITPLDDRKLLVYKIPKKNLDWEMSPSQKELFDKQTEFLNNNYRIHIINLQPKDFPLFFKDTLKHLLDLQVISYKQLEYDVKISRKSFSYFLDGNISVKDKNRFERYYKEILELCDFIKNDGLKRFPHDYHAEKEKIKIVRPVDLPPNTKWENITIRFLDGHETIIIAKDKQWHSNFQEMGFENKRNGLPNKQWLLLQTLSTKNNNELSWENNKKLKLETVWQIKTQKKLLSMALKKYFGIQEDPFYDYRKEKAYRIKIRLIPEKSSKEDSNDETNDFLDKAMPIVYDPNDK